MAVTPVEQVLYQIVNYITAWTDPRRVSVGYTLRRWSEQLKQESSRVEELTRRLDAAIDELESREDSTVK